jgi:hypothetical protein
MSERPTKITFAEMRDMGVRGLLIYCADYRCSHLVTMSGNRWPDDLRLSDIEPRFICSACGKRGADVRPDFSWNKAGAADDGIPVRRPKGEVANRGGLTLRCEEANLISMDRNNLTPCRELGTIK